MKSESGEIDEALWYRCYAECGRYACFDQIDSEVLAKTSNIMMGPRELAKEELCERLKVHAVRS